METIVQWNVIELWFIRLAATRRKIHIKNLFTNFRSKYYSYLFSLQIRYILPLRKKKIAREFSSMSRLYEFEFPYPYFNIFISCFTMRLGHATIAREWRHTVLELGILLCNSPSNRSITQLTHSMKFQAIWDACLECTIVYTYCRSLERKIIEYIFAQCAWKMEKYGNIHEKVHFCICFDWNHLMNDRSFGAAVEFRCSIN